MTNYERDDLEPLQYNNQDDDPIDIPYLVHYHALERYKVLNIKPADLSNVQLWANITQTIYSALPQDSPKIEIHRYQIKHASDAWYHVGKEKDGSSTYRLKDTPVTLGRIKSEEKFRIYRNSDRLIYAPPTPTDPRSNKGDPKIWRTFSNYQAVNIWAQVLQANRILRPIRGIPERLEEWASLETGYIKTVRQEDDGPVEVSGSRHYYIETDGYHDYPVHATFEKLDKESMWSVIPPLEESEQAKFDHQTTWRLLRKMDDPLQLYAQSTDMPQIFKIEESVVEEGAEARDPYTDAVILNLLLGSSSQRWHFVRSLDRRDPPVAHLNVLVSNQNLIVDHIVVKKLENDTEARDHRMLSNKDKTHIIKCEGSAYREDDRKYPYRLYIEYAPFGTLYSMMKMPKYQDPDGPPIPELFLWLLARNLASACVTLEDLGLTNVDMKPENILIKDRDEHDKYPAYNTPVLGDFGLLVHGYHRVVGFALGTRGWLPPETYRFWETGESVITPALHVYSIGLILWSAMRRRLGGLYNYDFQRPKRQSKDGSKHTEQLRKNDPILFRQLPFPGDTRQGPQKNPLPPEPFVPEDDNMFYSHALERFVMDCMKIEPGDRLSLEDVEDKINFVLHRWSVLLPGFAKEGACEVPEHMAVALQEEEFGLKVNERFVHKKRRRL